MRDNNKNEFYLEQFGFYCERIETGNPNAPANILVTEYNEAAKGNMKTTVLYHESVWRMWEKFKEVVEKRKGIEAKREEEARKGFRNGAF